MLDATSSTELVEWFAYLRIEDERREQREVRVLNRAIGGGQ